MEKEATLDALVNAAVKVGLDGTDAVAKYSYEELGRIYNGIGSDAMPERIRERVTDYLSLFEPAALIHDVRYHESDGTSAAWHEANQEFLHNCLELVARKYGWINIFRVGRAKIAAYAMFDFVESPLGHAAWMKAFEERAKR